jgi:hypothetical protein
LMVLVLTQGSAYAYVDPGTGSMLWQLLLGGAIGLLFYVRKATTWMARLRAKKKADRTHQSADAFDKSVE